MELNINNLIPWDTGISGVGANYKCILCKVYPMNSEDLGTRKEGE